jgi:hypothetical protein
MENFNSFMLWYCNEIFGMLKKYLLEVFTQQRKWKLYFARSNVKPTFFWAYATQPLQNDAFKTFFFVDIARWITKVATKRNSATLSITEQQKIIQFNNTHRDDHQHYYIQCNDTQKLNTIMLNILEFNIRGTQHTNGQHNVLTLMLGTTSCNRVPFLLLCWMSLCEYWCSAICVTQHLCDPTFVRPIICATQHLCDPTILWLNFSMTQHLCDPTFLWSNICTT